MWATRGAVVLVCAALLAPARAAAPRIPGPQQVLYQPARSDTFVAHKEMPFTVQYADANAIEAITCVDYVQLGEYKARVPFACFMKSSTPQLRDVDGVAGFGIPKVGANGETLPMPLLWALTDPRNVESNAKGLKRRYSFFANRDHAEVQLGGFDPQSVKGGKMDYIKSLTPGEFIVPVESIKVGRTRQGAQEILKFKDSIDPNAHGLTHYDTEIAKKQEAAVNFIPAVLDTGTSCLILPSNDHGGMLEDSPFGLFVKHFQRPPHLFSAGHARLLNDGHKVGESTGTSVFMTVAGKELELPYETLLITGTDKPCVRGSPPLQQGSIILGDVFFRQYSVLFDMEGMSRSTPATIGLAEINPEYKIIPEAERIIPVEEMGEPLMRMHVHRGVDKLPIEDNKKGTQYYVQLTIGTPPQLFKMAFDTGSSTLGVFTSPHAMTNVVTEEMGRPIPVVAGPYPGNGDAETISFPSDGRVMAMQTDAGGRAEALLQTRARAQLAPTAGGLGTVPLWLQALVGGMLGVAVLAVVRRVRRRKSALSAPLMGSASLA